MERKKKKKNNSACAYCGDEFYCRPSKIAKSKSGLLFCCRKHKDLAQRIGGIKAIQPSHYTDDGRNYRKKAFAFYPNECNQCGYDRHPEVLDVHHKDYDRTNCDMGNLEILCPTCHMEHHFVTKTGKWRSRSA